MSVLVAAAMAAIERQRRALERAFGWTLLAVAAREDSEARALVLRGEVALPRMIAGVEGRLAPLLPPGWRLDVAGVSARAGLGWRTPGPGVARLWRAPRVVQETGAKGHVLEGRSGGTRLARGTCAKGQVEAAGWSGLASELVAADGPVLLLAAGPGAWSLVRAGDGTVGWLHGALTRARAPVAARRRRVAEATALRRLTLRLRGHLGVPYLLGGTTRRHIDCSGLVQRCVREALGVVLPRHSTDQAAGWVAPGRALGEPGDLLFMAGLDAAQCHVGVVLQGSRPGARTLLHASARRGQVVEEPLEECLGRVRQVQHVELAQLLELA